VYEHTKGQQEEVHVRLYGDGNELVSMKNEGTQLTSIVTVHTIMVMSWFQ